MTLIKINGNLRKKKSGFIVFFLFIIFSCSTIKEDVIKHNYFNKDYFYNDSLKVAIDFWGALSFKDITKIKRKEVKKELQNYKQLSLDNMFVLCSSTANKYNMYFFYETVIKTHDSLVHERITLQDTLKKITIFEKQKGNKKIIGFIKSFEYDNKYSSTLANEIMKKISIDSFDNNNLSYYKIWFNYSIKSKNKLQARKKIMTAPIKDIGENGPKFQFLATANSFLSNNFRYDTLINGYEKKRKNNYNEVVEKLSKNQDVKKNQDVFNEISEIAKNNSIIMLNEDHYYPKHRLFAMELLDVLKQNGYTYLSLEAFSLNEKNVIIPNYNNGIYVSEPYFAHFIRKAKEMGFTVLGHENTDNTIDRELGQAKNILKILEQDPKAKIFVYVGHSHIEKEYNNKKWMAQYFKEFSNINPITINQVSICSDIKEDLILIPRKYFIKDNKTKSSADYFLVNNLKSSLKSIYPNISFKDYILKSKNFENLKNKELIVEVFNEVEYNKLKELTIPLINILAIPKAHKIELNLPIGKYHVFVKSEDNKELYNNIIIVK